MGEGLLAGLEEFGLGDLEGMNLFEEKKSPGALGADRVAAAAPVLTEKDFILEKTTKCPLCNSEFKAKVVKGSKAKLVGSDLDLRPRHQELDTVKYDVLSCPFCGYTALIKYYPTLLSTQAKRIREKISMNYRPKPDTGEIYSYDDAIDRYKLALVNAVVKEAKASEKAYICLKSSWIFRGKAEELGEGHAEYAKYKAMEFEYTKNAYEGFMQAVSKESFPMCGMDETTVNYLIAVLAFMTEHFDVCSKMIASILTSQVAPARMKDKARDLKDEVMKKLKEKSQG